MGPLGELGALFNPGMRHEIEERKSKANRREEEGNARDGDLRIDLASGVAVINLSKNGENASAPVRDADPEHESPTGQPDAAREASTPEAGDTADGPAGTAAPSAGPAADPGEPAAVAGPATNSLTAAQERRLAAAARRSAKGDRPARPATPRPANAQLPSSKASRAAR